MQFTSEAMIVFFVHYMICVHRPLPICHSPAVQATALQPMGLTISWCAAIISGLHFMILSAPLRCGNIDIGDHTPSSVGQCPTPEWSRPYRRYCC